MGFPQARHLPLSHRKLKIGILSYHFNGVLHLGQCDGGKTTDSPGTGIRSITTLRKLPIMVPKIKEMMRAEFSSIKNNLI